VRIWDVIVIGSGFGGAILAARLAEQGRRVLVLERGRWWDSKASAGRTAYPRALSDPWIWNQDRPERENGWVDFRHFRHMSVVQGAAVGGGSLIYANISAEAPQAAFDGGWPPELTFGELQPHMDRVAQIMSVAPLPPAQWTRRTQLMKDAADAIGAGSRFQPLNIAVSFDPAWRYGNDTRSQSVGHSKRFTNPHGVEQGSCVHLGECDIGCPADAKNTLDRNYLAIGQKHGLEIRPLHLVNAIEPTAQGYAVQFDVLGDGSRIPGSEYARKVVVAAGSLGSTELLLRCRDQHGTLPGISRRLGRGWCSNGDFLTPAYYPAQVINPTQGPTITSAINFLDGSEGPRFWVEDGGFFNLFVARALEPLHPLVRAGLARFAVREFQKLFKEVDPLPRVMPWFAQGMDESDGEMRLRRRWILFGRKRLHLDWNARGAEAVIDATIAKHRQLSEATGGHAVVPPTWTLDKSLVTPHPLGGCCMGRDAADGVVDHRGEVFGHPGLFVVDGSMIPRSLGVNPSRTIGGLAERAASLFPP
jgi:cholesterol oxidase